MDTLLSYRIFQMMYPDFFMQCVQDVSVLSCSDEFIQWAYSATKKKTIEFNRD